MRILVIHPHLHFFGGSERLARIFVYEAEKLGQEIIVLTKAKRDEWFPETEKVKFYFIEKIPKEFVHHRHVAKFMNVLYAMSDIFEKYEPDVVFVFIQEPIYAIAAKIVNPNIKVGMYVHFPIEEEATPENLWVFLDNYRFPNMYNMFYKSVDIVFVNSNYTGRAFYRLTGLQATTIYPAIEWDFYRDINIEEERENIILTVGRFVPQKRHYELVKWFREIIKKEVPDAKLVIIGNPDKRYLEYYERLKKICEETEDVILIDKVISNEEMIEWYKKAKIYVHLRIGEHFGMAPVEAMALGCIPIVPRKSGLAELIVHGEDGFIASSDKEFLEYMLKLLKDNKGEIIKMRRNAVKKAWFFNPRRFAKEIIHYFEEVIKG